MKSGWGQVRLVHLHEVDAHEERGPGCGRLVEILRRGLLDVLVEERNPHHALRRRVDVLAVDLGHLAHRLPRSAVQQPLGDLREHRAQGVGHVREPRRVGVGVGVQVIEANRLHLVIPVGNRQRVVGLAEMPLAREEGPVASLLQHRRQRPFRRREAARLTLERHRGHAAPVRDAAGLHGGAPRRPAGLGVEGEEGHALIGQTVKRRRGHAASRAAAIGPRVPVSEVIGDDQDDVRLGHLGPPERRRDQHEDGRERSHEQMNGSTDRRVLPSHLVLLATGAVPGPAPEQARLYTARVKCEPESCAKSASAPSHRT